MEEKFFEQFYEEMHTSSFCDFQTIMRPFIIDRLTGFYNNKFFEMYLPDIQEYLLAAKKPRPSNCNKRVNTLLFADINNLKQVNDTKSYAIADEGIKKIIEIVNSNFSDFPNRANFRVGGDEFITIFPKTSREDLIPHVIAIEKEISNSKIELNNMSIAIGLSDTNEFMFSDFDSPKAKEYFFMLVSSSAIAAMQKRKKEIKFGDVEAENYATKYVSGSIQYLLRALGIEKPTDAQLKDIRGFMDNALTTVFDSLSSKSTEIQKEPLATIKEDSR